MNTGAKNIYRQKKNSWTPLLKFGGARTRTTADGWHSFPYNSPSLRTLGVRWKDASGNVLDNSVAYRNDGTYQTHATQLNYTCEINYDPSKVVAIWYRYAYVNEILYPLNSMPDLRILSFRGSAINFGALDLSNCPKFSHLEISNADGLANTIASVTFHPNANLKFSYLAGAYPQAVKDAVLTQAYNHRNTPDIAGMIEQRKLISISGYSASLQYMVDELIATYGWSVS